MVQQNAVHDRPSPPIRPTMGSTGVMATDSNSGSSVSAYCSAGGEHPRRNGARDLVDNGCLRITLEDVSPQASHEDC
jgi:hypothetical protein